MTRARPTRKPSGPAAPPGPAPGAARAIAAALTVAVGLAIAATPVLAHPMGNVSVNHYAGIEIGPAEIDVKYLLDYAEIPSVRELDRIDPDRDELVTPGEREAYLEAKSAEALAGLRLEVNGRPLSLRSVWSHVTFPPGEGGLSTVRIAWQLRAEIPDTLREARNLLVWSDENHADREGWKEIRFAGVGGIGVGRTSLRRDLRSGELSEYPEEYLWDPPRDTKAWCQFGPGLTAPAAGPTGADDDGFAPPEGFGGDHGKDPFVALITAETMGPRVVLVSLLLALLLGAGHALEPGHGKTIVAAYLVGTRGTVGQAIALGLVVTVTHTFSVFLLGAGVLVLSRYVVPETLLPWLGAVSGALIAAVGLLMLRRRLRERRAASAAGRAHGHDRAHGHAHHRDHAHAHHHDHPHDHDHGHTHVPPGRASLGSILALGISGGLVPCPAGLVVLLAAVSLGRVAFGLLLIVAFSIGLAVVLTGIGVLFVVARRFLDRMPLAGRFVNGLGIASAVVVTVFGVVLAARSLAGGG